MLMTAKILFKSLQEEKPKVKIKIETCKCMSYYRRTYTDMNGVRKCDECYKPIYDLDI